MGESFVAAGTWMHMDGPRGASGSSYVQQRKDWAMDFVYISEVQLLQITIS